MHSVMNTVFAPVALKKELTKKTKLALYEALSGESNKHLRDRVEKAALQRGMMFIKDESGTNIDVQIQSCHHSNGLCFRRTGI